MSSSTEIPKRVKLMSIPDPIETPVGEYKPCCTIGQVVKHYIKLVPDVIEQFSSEDEIYIDAKEASKYVTKSFIERTQNTVYLYDGLTSGPKKFKFNGGFKNLPKLYIGSIDGSTFINKDDFAINQLIHFEDIYAVVPGKKIKIIVNDVNVSLLDITYTTTGDVTQTDVKQMLSARFYPPYIFRYNINDVITHSNVADASININFDVDISNTTNLTSLYISTDMPNTNSLDKNENLPVIRFTDSIGETILKGEKEQATYKITKNEYNVASINFDLYGLIDDVNVYIEGTEVSSVKFKIFANKALFVRNENTGAQEIGISAYAYESLYELINYAGNCLFDNKTEYVAGDPNYVYAEDWTTSIQKHREICVYNAFDSEYFSAFVEPVVKLNDTVLGKEEYSVIFNKDKTERKITYVINDIPEGDLPYNDYSLYMYVTPKLNDIKFVSDSVTVGSNTYEYDLPEMSYIKINRASSTIGEFTQDYTASTNIDGGAVTFNYKIPIDIHIGFSADNYNKLLNKVIGIVNNVEYTLTKIDSANELVLQNISIDSNNLIMKFYQLDATPRQFMMQYYKYDSIEINKFKVYNAEDDNIFVNGSYYKTGKTSETNSTVKIYVKLVKPEELYVCPKPYKGDIITTNYKISDMYLCAAELRTLADYLISSYLFDLSNDETKNVCTVDGLPITSKIKCGLTFKPRQDIKILFIAYFNADSLVERASVTVLKETFEMHKEGTVVLPNLDSVYYKYTYQSNYTYQDLKDVTVQFNASYGVNGKYYHTWHHTFYMISNESAVETHSLQFVEIPDIKNATYNTVIHGNDNLYIIDIRVDVTLAKYNRELYLLPGNAFVNSASEPLLMVLDDNGVPYPLIGGMFMLSANTTTVPVVIERKEPKSDRAIIYKANGPVGGEETLYTFHFIGESNTTLSQNVDISENNGEVADGFWYLKFDIKNDPSTGGGSGGGGGSIDDNPVNPEIPSQPEIQNLSEDEIEVQTIDSSVQL